MLSAGYSKESVFGCLREVREESEGLVTFCFVCFELLFVEETFLLMIFEGIGNEKVLICLPPKHCCEISKNLASCIL